MAFSTDHLKISRDPRVADEPERSFFNATLGSLLNGEPNFTYMNDSNGSREPARTVPEGHSYVGGRDMSCCQANGHRGFPQITERALLCDGKSLYLNYYGACALETYAQNGHAVRITQDTVYPKNGAIRIFFSYYAAVLFLLTTSKIRQAVRTISKIPNTANRTVSAPLSSASPSVLVSVGASVSAGGSAVTSVLSAGSLSWVVPSPSGGKVSSGSVSAGSVSGASVSAGLLSSSGS
ncbi:MAG: glycoside hydrolase family 127 protein [Clostridia bacterium]|nr:glycoside hydrolase family 127 protein [Clostridia bacterium]